MRKGPAADPTLVAVANQNEVDLLERIRFIAGDQVELREQVKDLQSKLFALRTQCDRYLDLARIVDESNRAEGRTLVD